MEKITEKFYQRFKKQHCEFLLCVEGITDQGDREWYTSLMLNRLMFLYFIQQKSFLAGDKNYLYNRLMMQRGERVDLAPTPICSIPAGQESFVSFYRCFLLKLFHDGLNKRERSPSLEQLLGNVPYLNSDLFAIHVLERKYPAIQIADSAFERLFAFFQAYNWHLDDDPDQGPTEINPDMLGCIFERFINQREKGAYYTKEDVTEYISKNTIIPFIFGAVAKKCPDAFSPDGLVWSLLHANGEDSIYAHGIDDFITDNLDIYEFIKNVIASCDADLLLSFYESIEAVTILDPTCGSGAFLFAALRILYPLYEACLLRMQAMVDAQDQFVGAGFIPAFRNDPGHIAFRNDPGHIAFRNDPDHIEHFRIILQHVEAGQAPLQYFILKSIITKNLYGVDLMEEAVELCKLRFFLKLLAHIDKPEDIEALSDIGFNVYMGNALLGCACAEEACPLALGGRYFGARDTHVGTGVSLANNGQPGKEKPLSAPAYHALPATTPPAPIIQQSQPFHWCIEFERIMKSGGFSVIIGNPPYVEYNAAKFPYQLQYFETLACANLYPCVVERSHQLLSPQGYIGMILPLAAFATKNMIPFIEGFYNWFPCSWLSFYHFRPSMLFSGGKVASIPTAIFLAKATGPEQRFSTNLMKWPTDKRAQLFSHLTYCPVTVARDRENRHYYPKLGHTIENAIMEKILRHQRVEQCLAKISNDNTMWYRSAGGLYWKVFVNFPWPYETTSNKRCSFQSGYQRNVFVALFNSSLFWWYYTVTFDTFNLKDYMLFGFRFSYPEDTTLVDALCSCCHRLMDDFRANAQHLKRGKTGSYTVYARKSKHIIDDIDRLLAHHYGFTDEELEFIINYDITYRMGYNYEHKG